MRKLILFDDRPHIILRFYEEREKKNSIAVNTSNLRVGQKYFVFFYGTEKRIKFYDITPSHWFQEIFVVVNFQQFHVVYDECQEICKMEENSYRIIRWWNIISFLLYDKLVKRAVSLEMRSSIYAKTQQITSYKHGCAQFIIFGKCSNHIRQCFGHATWPSSWLLFSPLCSGSFVWFFRWFLFLFQFSFLSEPSKVSSNWENETKSLLNWIKIFFVKII